MGLIKQLPNLFYATWVMAWGFCPFPASAVGFEEINLLSDEFDQAETLGEWNRVYQAEGWGFDQLELWDIDTTLAGRMVMMPYTSSWYQEWRGVHAYKAVSGDFVVTTEVQPTARSGSGPPGSSFSLAGLFVRTPRPGVTNAGSWTPNGENYVFLSLGTADRPGNWQFEVKTTRNSISTLETSPGTSRARLQIARIGPYFIALRESEGGSWTVHRRYTRTDMPADLHVGLTTYTDWSTCGSVGYQFHNTHLLTNGLSLPGGGTLNTANPDLIAAFDYIRFQRPQLPAYLVGSNLADPGQVSDGELLSFLGASANVPGGASSPPTLTALEYSPGIGFSMQLDLQTNRSYRVQSIDSLGSTHWLTLTNFVSTTNRMQFQLAITGDQSRQFYRIVSP